MRWFVFILFWPHWTTGDQIQQLVIWNVGQGQMVSWISQKLCLHIDAGGDRPAPLQKISQLCSLQQNIQLVTHYDKDHVNFIAKLQRSVNRYCLKENLPAEISTKKKYFLKSIPICKAWRIPQIQNIFTPALFKDNDGRSYALNNNTLVTGDAPIATENKFAQSARRLSITYMVIGHHGSRTSSGQQLLKNLAHIKQAFVSARKKRYGHPHKETLQRLRENGIPLLSTEEFGNIHVYFWK